jgi:hypothetical protein
MPRKDERLVVRSAPQRLIDQDHRYLRQRLDDHYPGITGSRKMPFGKRLVDGDVLDGLMCLPGVHLMTYRRKKRRPMRQVSHDLLDIITAMVTSLSPDLFSPVRARTRVAKSRSLRSTDAILLFTMR